MACKKQFCPEMSAKFFEELASALCGLVLLGLIFGVGLHLKNRLGLRARVRWSLHLVVGFGEAQAQERVVAADAQALLQLLDRALAVAAHHFRQVEVYLAEREVGASLLVAFVEFDDRLHLAAYVWDGGERVERALHLRSTAEIRAEPEVAFRTVGRELDGGLARGDALAEGVQLC